MANIHLAAEDLAKKPCSPCTDCGTPGFWVVARAAEQPCADCDTPTREIRAEVHGYRKCAHRLMRARSVWQYAGLGRCDYCNP